MASTQVLLLQLLLVSLAAASHYYGGTATFTYKGRNPDGTFKVDIRNRDTYDGCRYFLNWNCYNGHCGSNVRVPQNCPRTYRLMSFDPDGDQVRCRYGNVRGTECWGCNQPSGFHLDQDSCTLHYRYTQAHIYVYAFELMVEDFPRRPITLTYTDGSSSSSTSHNPSPMVVVVAFYTRSTNHNSNLTPMEVVVAFYTCSTNHNPRVVAAAIYNHNSNPYLTPMVVVVAFYTRCTNHNPRVVAAAIYNHNSNPNLTPMVVVVAFYTRCTNHNSNLTPMEVVVAFYTCGWWQQQSTPAAPTTAYPSYTTTRRRPYASTPPLSKLPLQFSFLVDPPAPSCQEGAYLPMLVKPTPQHGERVHAQVNKEVEIRVKAYARYSTLHDIIISGPTNTTKHRNTHDEYVIRWTPVPEDLGEYFPICFAVESFTGSGVYQSEMRCVVVHVMKEEVKTNVICGESTMTVEVEKSSLSGFHEDHLQLSDPTNTACSLDNHSNSTHVIAVIPLNACGTQLEEDDENLIFKNEITTTDDHRDLITRKHLLEVEFYCQYPKRQNMTLGFTAHRRNITVWDKGFGTFTYQFEFYQNNQFQTRMDPSSYPLEYDVGSRIYMEIEASSSVNNTELFVESCWAAPYDNPNYWPTYPIIENGCQVDETVKIHSSDNPTQFRFCMEAFKFIGLHDQVYISCSVMVCEAGNPNTRCSRGCVNSTRSGGHHHRKREAVFQSANHFVSQGPLRIRRSAEDRTNLNLNLNLVFIAGCLLAAVGMICAVVMYKTKTSMVKYQPLPVFED
ncbi:uncharacterized protein LOC128366419 [Scomber japonicus]|uniref:uncharacterized protein LOC128366419 n=1 Tax=Scomber japonicus TaxID=13676 RepID=UPI0023050030|nr:uncharacterized protein LOC128366419 [Scomber japonicus]